MTSNLTPNLNASWNANLFDLQSVLRAIKLIARSSRISCGSRVLLAYFAALAMLGLLGGCSALPDKPVRPTLYDFGPGNLTIEPTTRQAPLPPVALEEITTSGGALDNTALLYRLAYAEVQALRPYANARWSTLPAQLVRQRLREQLSQRRPVFNARDGVSINRSSATMLPLRLRLELEEFSQLFTAPDASVGVVRLRATLVEVTPAGERFIGQRSVVAQRPAPTADAAGGVRALTAATDAAIDELDQWLQQSAVR